MATESRIPTPLTKLSIERLWKAEDLNAIYCSSLRVKLDTKERIGRPFRISKTHVFSYDQQVNPTIGKFYAYYFREGAGSQYHMVEEIKWNAQAGSFMSLEVSGDIPVWVLYDLGWNSSTPMRGTHNISGLIV